SRTSPWYRVSSNVPAIEAVASAGWSSEAGSVAGAAAILGWFDGTARVFGAAPGGFWVAVDAVQLLVRGVAVCWRGSRGGWGAGWVGRLGGGGGGGRGGGAGGCRRWRGTRSQQRQADGHRTQSMQQLAAAHAGSPHPARRAPLSHKARVFVAHGLVCYPLLRSRPLGFVALAVVALLVFWHPARVAAQTLFLLPALFPGAPLDPLALVAAQPTRTEHTFD